jgi:hypothetical protein
MPTLSVSEVPDATPQTPRPRRPWSITLLAVLALCFAMFHLLRMVLTVARWDLLIVWLSIPPAYLVINGLVWGAAGLPLAWGLWRGKPWAPRLFWVVALVYTLFYWIDRLWLAGYPERNADWPFAAGANLVLLVWCAWILWRAKVKGFFGVIHERSRD